MAHAKFSDALFPSLPDRFFEGDLIHWSYASENSNLPAINSKENDNQYSIEVAAPGLMKDDFKVNNLSNLLPAFLGMLQMQKESVLNMRMVFFISLYHKGGKSNTSTSFSTASISISSINNTD